MSLLNDMRFWASLPVLFLLGLAALAWRCSHHTTAVVLLVAAAVVGLVLAVAVWVLAHANIN